MAKKSKFYVVWEGNEPGIYRTWADCQLQIKGYPNAKYKSFPTVEAATEAFRGHYADFYDFNKIKKSKPTIDTISTEIRKEIVWGSIAVDAACAGNPGIMEYQGVDTKTGERLFHQKFSLGTNNIGEFLALVHALAMFKKQGSNLPIYTDSKIAMGWVFRKKCKTKLVRNRKTEQLHGLIVRAESWLNQNNFSNKIMKWETERWGEIPADFGRK